MRRLLMLISLVLFLSTCKHLSVEDPTLPGSGNPVVLPTPEVCFNTQILPLIKSNCANASGCHSTDKPQENLVLMSYASIKKIAREGELMEVLQASSLKKRMPYLKPPLEPSQLALIKRWIDEGMKETICIDDCDTLNVTYTRQVQPLINSYCKGCHTGYAAGGGVSLETYATVSNQVLNGKVICTVTAKGCTLMPKGGPALSDCNIRKLILWKEAGCPQ